MLRKPDIYWEWREPNGKYKGWISFGEALSREMEFGYTHLKDPTFKVPPHFDRFGSRVVSFERMELCGSCGDARMPLEVRTLEKGRTRKVARWYWVEKGGELKAYGESKDVEEAFQRNDEKFILGEKKYEIDFNSMIQTNIKTRFTRPILRITPETEPFSCRDRVYITPLYHLVTRPIKGTLSILITKLKNLKLSGIVEIEFLSSAAQSWQIKSNSSLFPEEPTFPDPRKIFDICGKPDDTLNFTLYQHFPWKKEFVGVLEIDLKDVRNDNFEGLKTLTYQKKRDDLDAQLHIEYSFESLVEETQRTITVRSYQSKGLSTKTIKKSHKLPPTQPKDSTKTQPPKYSLYTSAVPFPSMITDISNITNSQGSTETKIETKIETNIETNIETKIEHETKIQNETETKTNTEKINPPTISPTIETTEITPSKWKKFWDNFEEPETGSTPQTTNKESTTQTTNEESTTQTTKTESTTQNTKKESTTQTTNEEKEDELTDEDTTNEEKEDELTDEDMKEFYDFGETIGSGSFAQILKAKDKEEGTDVAIKIIPTEQTMTDTDFEAIETEITILNFLRDAKESCAYCLSSIDYFETEKFVYIIMPLAECSVFDIISQEMGLNSSKAATVMFGLLEAIQYLHKHFICHRDIKPENILVMDKKDLKQIKLADYGSSKNLHAGPMSEYVGTEAYMAPEVPLGLPYTPAIDYWSAGVVAYVLIAGHDPWKNDESITIQLMGKQEDWEALEKEVARRELDMEVVDFVKGLMQRDVNQRWDAEIALNHNWINKNYPL